MPYLDHCECEACLALAVECGDPAILRFYRKRLLIRGWAGNASKAERAYIMAHAEWAQQAAATVAGKGSLRHQNTPMGGEETSSMVLDTSD